MLGHSRLHAVNHYRKMNNQVMADETRKIRNMMSDIIMRIWMDGVWSMNKYDKMLEVNRKTSEEKVSRARLAIKEMLQEQEKITISVLMKKTGLSRGFFYKNL